MPNRNGTGPEGKGPKTGRGLGNCAGDTSETNEVPLRGAGLGLGRGQGAGRGMGRGQGAGRGLGRGR